MRSQTDIWNKLVSKFNSRRDASHKKPFSGCDRKLRYELCEQRQMLTTFTVTSPLDGPATTFGAEPRTLRQAIFDANFAGTVDTIDFDASLNGATITLNQGQGFLGELRISDLVTIDATALSNGITIDASGNDTNPGTPDGMGSKVFNIVDVVSGTGDFEYAFKGLTLTGADSSSTGGAISFNLSGNATETAVLTIEDSTIRDNNAAQGGGGVRAAEGIINITRSDFITNSSTLGSGGGVQLTNNITSASITDSMFFENVAELSGGGLWLELRSLGTQEPSQEVTITRSVFEANSATGEANTNNNPDNRGNGGGIFANLRGAPNTNDSTEPRLHIFDSTLGNNTAAWDGGGIWVCTKYGAEFNVDGSTFSDNHAGTLSEGPSPSVSGGDGGGLWLAVQSFDPDDDELDVNLTNTTVSGNTGLNEGGGVWIGGTDSNTDGDLDADLRFVTITNNNSPVGGGLFSQLSQQDRDITTILYHTIVSGNFVSGTSGTASNIAGAIDGSSSFNLIGPGISATDTSNDPGLFGLAKNNGITWTHKPKDTSDLIIDAGDPNFVAPPSVDQRGFPRVRDIPNVNDPTSGSPLIVDIGAVERQPIDSTVPKVTNVKLSNGTDTFNFATSGRIGTGEQVLQLPYSGINKVEIVFSESVDLPAASEVENQGLRLLDAYGTIYALAAPTGDGTSTITWQLDSGTIPNIRMVLIELSDRIIDATGNNLDGEWVNPEREDTVNVAISEFPSGNDVVGGDFHFAFVTHIPGDFNGDNFVGNGDLTVLLDRWGQVYDPSWEDWVTDLPAGSVGNPELTHLLDNWGEGWNDFIFLLMGDTDGDYDVDALDREALRDHFGLSGQDRSEGDLTGDGLVSNEDLTALLDAWGLDVEFVGT